MYKSGFEEWNFHQSKRTRWSGTGSVVSALTKSENYISSGARGRKLETRREFMTIIQGRNQGAKEAESPSPLSQVKVEEKDYPPSYLILSHSSS